MSDFAVFMTDPVTVYRQNWPKGKTGGGYAVNADGGESFMANVQHGTLSEAEFKSPSIIQADSAVTPYSVSFDETDPELSPGDLITWAGPGLVVITTYFNPFFGTYHAQCTART